MVVVVMMCLVTMVMGGEKSSEDDCALELAVAVNSTDELEAAFQCGCGSTRPCNITIMVRWVGIRAVSS